jgi:CHASE2 domain-containing sensor protein
VIKKIARRVCRALPIIVAITVLMFVGESHHWFDRFEAPGLDVFARIDPPLRWQNVRIVGIDDSDYASRFHSTSPLNAREVQKLIDAIAKTHPSVIGVDLDTSGEAWKTIAIDPKWPPIVWATVERVDQQGELGTPVPVLGGRGPTRSQDRTGIALVQPDFDGVIRRYRRSYYDEPAFAYAVVQKYCALQPPSEGCAAFRTALRLHSADPEPPVLHVLGNPSDAGTDYLPARLLQEAEADPKWRIHNPYDGKIVVLGALFADSRDVHITPVRPMYGVEIVTQAIENELGGASTPAFNMYFAILLDVLAGIVLVVISCLFDFFPALLISLVGVPLLAVAISFTAFSSSLFWFDYTPLLVGVFLHELWEHAREYTTLRGDHEKLRIDHERLKAQHDVLHAQLAKIHGSTSEPTVPDAPKPAEQPAHGA